MIRPDEAGDDLILVGENEIGVGMDHRVPADARRIETDRSADPQLWGLRFFLEFTRLTGV